MLPGIGAARCLRVGGPTTPSRLEDPGDPRGAAAGRDRRTGLGARGDPRRHHATRIRGGVGGVPRGGGEPRRRYAGPRRLPAAREGASGAASRIETNHGSDRAAIAGRRACAAASHAPNVRGRSARRSVGRRMTTKAGAVRRFGAGTIGLATLGGCCPRWSPVGMEEAFRLAQPDAGGNARGTVWRVAVSL